MKGKLSKVIFLVSPFASILMPPVATVGKLSTVISKVPPVYLFIIFVLFAKVTKSFIENVENVTLIEELSYKTSST